MASQFRALRPFVATGCAALLLFAFLPASAEIVSVTFGGTSAPISPKSPNALSPPAKESQSFLKHSNPRPCEV